MIAEILTGLFIIVAAVLIVGIASYIVTETAIGPIFLLAIVVIAVLAAAFLIGKNALGA